jgi:hypothetical protein
MMLNVIEPKRNRHLSRHIYMCRCKPEIGCTLVGYTANDLSNVSVWLGLPKSSMVLFINLHHPDRTAYMFKRFTNCPTPLKAIPEPKTLHADYHKVMGMAARCNMATTCAWKNFDWFREVLRRPSSSLASVSASPLHQEASCAEQEPLAYYPCPRP